MKHIIINQNPFKKCAVCERLMEIDDAIVWDTDLDYQYHFDCYETRTLKDLELLKKQWIKKTMGKED